MLTNFVGNIKRQMFYQFWKFKLDMLIINHFIMENKLHGMITRCSLCQNTLLARYKEVKYQLKQSFLHAYQI